MKILHLVFHPNLSKSRVNKTWKQQIEDSGKVNKSRDVYEEYPDFCIDVEKEQADLVAHDRIIVQYPFYWYSVPPLLKKWMDDVLTYNFAYGTKGDKLMDKELQLMISVGGPSESYMPGGYNSFSIQEFLKPLQQTATLCRMKFLPALWMHDSVAASYEDIENTGKKWLEILDDPDRSDPWAVQRKAEEKAVKLT
ncbi:NAD(P)H-dependent oxidoreductase [Candidatus Uabimicrobium amorphum]|uniref:General stress protein 14 n=1 Tax=Uabimicrobium amorphum TaxID=2596890 RepID=A0A5S9INT8_UABAM|nr:NAD(P)H-dependent oxidoreductase [Candidatus Uabimicrobium amorphum]BBM85333.1 general stress protein 14 [Candidatus Uabimicrobium amorphum]